jgi:hypothetical protein
MPTNELLIQITAPHFCAGLVLSRVYGGWTVTAAAPLVRYMLGWSADRVKSYVTLKGWKAVRASHLTVV